MPYGVVAIAWSYVAFCIISTLINIYPNKSILNYGYVEQFKDLGNNLVVGIIMGAAVWSVTLLPMNYFTMLFMQVIVGVTLYYLTSKFFKVESFKYINQLVSNQIKKHKKQ